MSQPPLPYPGIAPQQFERLIAAIGQADEQHSGGSLDRQTIGPFIEPDVFAGVLGGPTPVIAVAALLNNSYPLLVAMGFAEFGETQEQIRLTTRAREWITLWGQDRTRAGQALLDTLVSVWFAGSARPLAEDALQQIARAAVGADWETLSAKRRRSVQSAYDLLVYLDQAMRDPPPSPAETAPTAPPSEPVFCNGSGSVWDMPPGPAIGGAEPTDETSPHVDLLAPATETLIPELDDDATQPTVPPVFSPEPDPVARTAPETLFGLPVDEPEEQLQPLVAAADETLVLGNSFSAEEGPEPPSTDSLSQLPPASVSGEPPSWLSSGRGACPPIPGTDIPDSGPRRRLTPNAPAAKPWQEERARLSDASVAPPPSASQPRDTGRSPAPPVEETSAEPVDVAPEQLVKGKRPQPAAKGQSPSSFAQRSTLDDLGRAARRLPPRISAPTPRESSVDPAESPAPPACASQRHAPAGQTPFANPLGRITKRPVDLHHRGPRRRGAKPAEAPASDKNRVSMEVEIDGMQVRLDFPADSVDAAMIETALRNLVASMRGLRDAALNGTREKEAGNDDEME